MSATWSQLNDLQRWLSKWRIAINVPKSTAIIFARAGRRFIQPRPVTLFGELIEWVDRTCYLGVTLDTPLTWSPRIDQVRKRTAQRIGMLGSLLNRKRDLSVKNGVLLYNLYPTARHIWCRLGTAHRTNAPYVLRCGHLNRCACVAINVYKL